MWQMTMAELTQDSFKPVKQFMHHGAWGYSCPVCGAAVGIYYEPNWYHDNRPEWAYKRDECKNGHKVDWRTED